MSKMSCPKSEYSHSPKRRLQQSLQPTPATKMNNYNNMYVQGAALKNDPTPKM